MRGIYGALVVAGAALLVCCNADPHRVSTRSLRFLRLMLSS